MPAMDEGKRLRSEAWAGLVEQVAPRASAAEVLQAHPTVAQSTRQTRASAKMARQSLTKVLVAVEAQPRDPAQLQILRTWASCIDDILALTDRLCGLVAAA
jgi:hypothetical protein